MRTWIANVMGRPMRLFHKGFLFYTAVVLPVLCHLLTLIELPNEPTWQSEDMADKLVFILSPMQGFPLLPFLGFSTVCMAVVLVSESRYAFHSVVRFGLLTGFFVCLFYAIIFGIAATENLGPTLFYLLGILSFLLIPGLVSAASWIRRRLQLSTRVSWLLGGFITSVFILGCTVVVSIRGPASEQGWLQNTLGNLAFLTVGIPFGFFILSCYLSTVWACLAYLWVGARILLVYPPTRSFSLAGSLAMIAWIAGFLSACRWSITLSLAEYSRLPVEDPGDCYVATAASRGHSRWVGSVSQPCRSRAAIRVNNQLRILKAGELALQCLMPRLHQRLRWVYNWVGPRLARRIQQPWQADCAYLLLKPFEWLTSLALYCVLGTRGKRWISRLYTVTS
jgi:hypothetical protein